MTTGVVAGVRDFFHNYFPERQLYHRCHGSVQFMTLSAPAQVGLLVITLGFLSWVAYASVNAMFKDQIIAAKERRFTQMQLMYDSQLHEMQSAYEELTIELANLQTRFTDATSELESKHKHLETLVQRREAINKSISNLEKRLAFMNDGSAETVQLADKNDLLMSVTEMEPAARESKKSGSFIAGAFASMASALSLPEASPEEVGRPMTALDMETSKIAGRMTSLGSAQSEFVYVLEEQTLEALHKLESIVRVTGLDVDHVLKKFHRSDTGQDGEEIGTGGPVISLAESRNLLADRNNDSEFNKHLYRLASHVERLSSLESALHTLPLAAPIDPSARMTSPFGRRKDPYTGRPAFHSGLDMVGPYKMPVHATSPGKVTYAGRRGPYGRLVEIDHGHGLKTRYAHLYRIKVKKGDHVGLQDVIGLLGSSGRSTGPHLHYEVWFNGKVRDPAKFFKAGRYVFQK